MKTIKNIIISLLLFTSFVMYADGVENETKSNLSIVTLDGKVSDLISGELLAGVEIRIDDIVTYSDFDGNYSIQLVPGDYNVKLKYISYEDKTKDLIIKSDSTVNINIGQIK